jgi:hypothetical protein
LIPDKVLTLPIAMMVSEALYVLDGKGMILLEDSKIPLKKR